jgi:hypothetical protein
MRRARRAVVDGEDQIAVKPWRVAQVATPRKRRKADSG